MKVTVQSIDSRREDDAELGVFVYAVATLEFVAHEGAPILLQEIRSGGLGDMGDADAAHLAEVEAEQRQELEAMLRGLGLLDEAKRLQQRDEALLQVQHVAYDGLLGHDAERIDQGHGTEAERMMYAKLCRINNIAEGCVPDEDRRPPPSHRGPEAVAGLTHRRRERGLPVGATSQEIGDSLIDQGFTAEPDPTDPRSTIFRPPPGEDNRG